MGSLFRNRRRELGLTQQEVGERIGVKKTEISKIENGRPITFSTINKIANALEVKPELVLKPTNTISQDVINYIVMASSMFARRHKLTRKEACNYLTRFKGLDFTINNYEAEHQLSLQQCVDDMTAICQRNGGKIS